MSFPNQTLLQDRYQLGSCLGHSLFSHTYEALDTHSQETVIIKELAFQQLDNWKSFELFRREAGMLAMLDHPAIPRFLDFFEVSQDQAHAFYLVQQKVPGQNLKQKLEAGWHLTEAQAKKIARKALKILVYLHRRPQPVIHRDIKPSNLILDDANHLYLIDFGAVQDVVKAQGSSTMVGTYGYMPLEQMAGRTLPASDLYSLGATLIHLLSGWFPGDLPQHELRLVFEDHVNCSWAFVQWLKKMLEPMVEDRFKRAAGAYLALDYVDEFNAKGFNASQQLQAKFTELENLLL